MYKIIDGRCTGKTSRLFLLAKENDGIIVCKNPQAMKNKALQYGIVGIDFISYMDFYQHRPKDRKFYIDEIEGFLSTIFQEGVIDGYTLSIDD